LAWLDIAFLQGAKTALINKLNEVKQKIIELQGQLQPAKDAIFTAKIMLEACLAGHKN
jgi:hypothetical protein